MTTAVTSRLSVFPLPGALLFPGLHLPLHIFEPRYRALISDAVARDRQIAMIQPRLGSERDLSRAPPLYDVGCVGHIGQIEKLEDGRFNIVLDGVARFRMVRELDVTTPFRQIEGVLIEEDGEDHLPIANRAALESESRRFAEAQGYAVDWESVARLDDRSLVNGVAQIAPFDVAAKQALIEANTLSDRADLLVQLMQFFGRHDGDDRVTLQ